MGLFDTPQLNEPQLAVYGMARIAVYQGLRSTVATQLVPAASELRALAFAHFDGVFIDTAGHGRVGRATGTASDPSYRNPPHVRSCHRTV